MRSTTGIVLMVLLVFVPFIASGIASGMNAIEIHSASVLDAATSVLFDDPVNIWGDSGFASQGWPGDGTPNSPYIIEGLNIATLPDEACITVRQTTASFIVRNCTLSSTEVGSGTGVLLVRVNNGTVANCTMSSLEAGVKLSGSDHCKLLNNTISHCKELGMYVYSGGNHSIIGNFVDDITDYGMYLYGVGVSDIRNNTLREAGLMGIVLYSAYNCSIVKNALANSTRFGIYVTSTANCTFVNNTFMNCGIGIAGSLQYWIHEFSDNIVNGKPFGYFLEVNDSAIDGGLYGQVYLISCFNVSVSSGLLNNVSVGVSLHSSANCTIINTEVKGNRYGINVFWSENITLTDNTLVDCGLAIDGSEIKQWTVNVSGNTVNGKPLGYFLNESESIIDADDFGQLILVNSEHLSIVNGTINNAYVGLAAFSCFNCSVENVALSYNSLYGVKLAASANCTFSNVTVRCSSYGFHLSESDNTTVRNSRIYDNVYGFWSSESDNCLYESNEIHNNQDSPFYFSGLFYGQIRNNTICNNGDSIYIYVGNYLEIINNTISGSSTNGIQLEFTSGIRILYNKIIHNSAYGLYVGSYSLQAEVYGNMIGFNGAGNAVDIGLWNEWDDGASIGNIWSDYDGTGAYVVGSLGIDNHPLGFLSHPADIDTIVGSPGPTVVHDVRLPNPDNYTVLWEGGIIAQGRLNSSVEHISSSFESLPLGSYNLTIIVYDESGHSLTDTVIINVIEEPTTTTTTSTITTTTSETTTTTSTSTTTTSTPPPPPPPDIPMVLLALIIGSLSGVVVLLVVYVIRKRRSTGFHQSYQFQ